MSEVERIECAIARWWPDIDTICARENVTAQQVQYVLKMMDQLERGEKPAQLEKAKRHRVEDVA